MSSPSSIRLLAPPVQRTTAVAAVAPAGQDEGFAPRRESGAARTERRNLPAIIRPAQDDDWAARPLGASAPYLAQHLAQEVLGPSRMSLDLRFHDHPGLAAYATMQAAEQPSAAQRRAWA